MPLRLPREFVDELRQQVAQDLGDEASLANLFRVVAGEEASAMRYREAAQTLLIGPRGLSVDFFSRLRAAAALFNTAAEADDHDAQIALGYLFAVGLVVPRNDPWAAYWFSRAALGGNRDAELALAAMYALGRGVPRDEVAAAFWFGRHPRLRAALYACGFGVEQDLPLARALYKEVAASGNPDADFELANMYARGCGGPTDVEGAIAHYRTAAQGGHPEAQIALSEMLRLFGAGSLSEACMWAELARIRLPESPSRDRAMAALDGAGGLLTEEERASSTEMARHLVIRYADRRQPPPPQ